MAESLVFTDPTPFEPAMPPDVRGLIEDARQRRGLAARWYHARSGRLAQARECQALIENPTALTPHQLGWLVGISMFADELRLLGWVLAHSIKGRAWEGLCPGILEAFAAGVQAGVPLAPQQWGVVEASAKQGKELPTAFLDVLITAVTSDSSVVRATAQRLFPLSASAALERLASASATARGKNARRLGEARERLAVSVGQASVGQASVGQASEPGGARAGQVGGRLPALLEAWAETRDPALIPAIQHAGAEAGRGRAPLRAASKGELEVAWLAAAAAVDPVDVPRLVGAPWPGQCTVGVERVRSLMRFPPDPRIAAALIVPANSWLDSSDWSIHVEVADALIRHGGVGLVPDVRSLAVGRGRIRGKVYRVAAEALERQAASEADPDLLATARVPLDLPTLWRAVFADPTDLDARRVLADALTEAQDPRGEFIALQLSAAAETGDTNPAARVARRRASALLNTHIDVWSGALPGVERGSRVFERGFLVALTASMPRASALDIPEWRMVERLTLDCDGPCDLLLDRMPVLERLAVRGTQPLGGPWPSVRTLALGREGDERGRRLLPDLRPFPNLEMWITSMADIRDLQGALGLVWGHARALGAIGVGLGGSDGDLFGFLVRSWRAAAASGAAPRELRLARGTGFGLNADGWLMVLDQRSPGHVDVAWGGGSAHERSRLPALLGFLRDEGITSARLHVGRGAAPELAIPRLGVRLDGSPIDFSRPPAG